MIKHVIKLRKDDILFSEGEPSKAMYIIEHGKIAITKIKKGSKVVLAELEAGDLIGEMAFFDNSMRSAGAKVISPTASLAELPYSSLRQEYKDMPIWIKTIIKSINNNLRTANDRIQYLEDVIKDLIKYN